VLCAWSTRFTNSVFSVLKDSLSPVLHGFSFKMFWICEDIESSLASASERRVLVVSRNSLIFGRREFRFLLVTVSDAASKDVEIEENLRQQDVQMRTDLISDFTESVVDIFDFASFSKVLQCLPHCLHLSIFLGVNLQGI